VTAARPGRPAGTPRSLPSVDAALRTPLGTALVAQFGRPAAVAALRTAIAAARTQREPAFTADTAAAAAHARLEAAQAPRVKPVFNLTGTVLHTNLGRARLAEEAIEAAVLAMREPVALELDLATGKRGERDEHVRELLCELTGAEDATVVNNNAGAVLIVLNTLAKGRGAVVSRGELIEIGGAFRLPEIMRRAGTKLVEVGTTNRTHARDYAEAIDANTGVVLKVHPSNYRIEGFTAAVPASELAALAHARGVPLVDDLGSGTLIDLTRFGLPHEPTVREAVATGADLVTFSGDKLLGGPQAGFIVGTKALVARIQRNPLKRALRLDKIRLAAIEATLKLYRNPERLAARLPTLRALARSRADIEACALRLLPAVAARLGARFTVAVVGCDSQVGSGSLPSATLPSAALAIRPARATREPARATREPARGPSGRALTALAAALRRLPVPVVGRIADDALLLDLRCLENEAAFVASLHALGGGATADDRA
jgi:L-seryl-tRNA(Ser) seleniumtransferase